MMSCWLRQSDPDRSIKVNLNNTICSYCVQVRFLEHGLAKLWLFGCDLLALEVLFPAIWEIYFPNFLGTTRQPMVALRLDSLQAERCQLKWYIFCKCPFSRTWDGRVKTWLDATCKPWKYHFLRSERCIFNNFPGAPRQLIVALCLDSIYGERCRIKKYNLFFFVCKCSFSKKRDGKI